MMKAYYENYDNLFTNNRFNFTIYLTIYRVFIRNLKFYAFNKNFTKADTIILIIDMILFKWVKINI